MKPVERASRELVLPLILPQQQALELAKTTIAAIGTHQRCSLTFEKVWAEGFELRLKAAGFVGSSLPSTMMTILVEPNGNGSLLQAGISRYLPYKMAIYGIIKVGTPLVAHIDTAEHCLNLLQAVFVNHLGGSLPAKALIEIRGEPPLPQEGSSVRYCDSQECDFIDATPEFLCPWCWHETTP